MSHNIYVRMTPLKNAGGRIDYISNQQRQEHLVATIDSAGDNQFWQELAAHCDQQAKEAGHDHSCQAREAHGDLDNRLAEIFKGREDELVRLISDEIKSVTGTENVTSLHWNKKMTNFHYHSVMAENKEVNEIKYGAVLTRNTYYDENGKRSTKKNCLDENGELKPGCKFYAKGEQIQTIQRFGTKEDLADPSVKEAIQNKMAKFQNNLLQEQKYKVYEDDGMHLTQQHVGNKVQGDIKEAIQNKNNLIKEWNQTVDEALAQGIDKAQIKAYRDDFKETIKETHNQETWRRHISAAKEHVGQLIQNIKENVLEPLEDVWKRLKHNVGVQKELERDLNSIVADHQQAKRELDFIQQEKEQHPQLFNAIEKIKRKIFGKKDLYTSAERQYSLASQNSDYYDLDKHSYKMPIEAVTASLDAKEREIRTELKDLADEHRDVSKALKECKQINAEDEAELNQRIKNPKILQFVKNKDITFQKFSFKDAVRFAGDPDKVPKQTQKQHQKHHIRGPSL